MRTIGTLLIFISIAGFACAQETQPLQISGTVFEFGGDGTSLRVSGASVTISIPDTDEVVGTTFTDSNGAFVFLPPNPGEYVVEIKKDGYSTTGTPTTRVRVDPARLVTQLPFYITRPGQLAGRVVDEDGAPVADVEVIVQRKLTPKGINVVTAKDGRFTASDLQPGPYSVRISPPAGQREMLVAKFTEDDVKIVDQALEASYWPGGTSEPAATIPVNPPVPPISEPSKSAKRPTTAHMFPLPRAIARPAKAGSSRCSRRTSLRMDREPTPLCDSPATSFAPRISW